MAEEPSQNPAGAPDDDRDAGRPIEALWTLEQDTAPSFFNRIRRRIYRRTTASQLISVSWHLPGLVFAELIGMLIHIVGARSMRKRD